MIAFWAAPTMTAARLFFAVVTTAYILTAIRFEEKDLVEDHGPAYAAYQTMVPMILPNLPTPVAAREMEALTTKARAN
jgi:protein-S-isoprenylcysteine O-methyltransferase Ste14